MRKLILTIAAIALAATGATAQLTVLKNGQSRFGKVPSALMPFGAASGTGTVQPPSPINQGDTLACAIFYGRYNDNESYIGFGSGKKVSIGAMPFNGTTTSIKPNYSLVMSGYDGIKATCRKGEIFSCMANASRISTFAFVPNVSAPGFITS